MSDLPPSINEENVEIDLNTNETSKKNISDDLFFSTISDPVQNDEVTIIFFNI
jgi:hypothetical protein